jgi:hypothetical protein
MHTTIDVLHDKNALAIESHEYVGNDHVNDEECAFVTPPANDCPANGDKANIEETSEMESDDQLDGNVEMQLAIESHENVDEEHTNDEWNVHFVAKEEVSLILLLYHVSCSFETNEAYQFNRA